jgi:hypothetical protein
VRPLCHLLRSVHALSVFNVICISCTSCYGHTLLPPRPASATLVLRLRHPVPEPSAFLAFSSHHSASAALLIFLYVPLEPTTIFIYRKDVLSLKMCTVN